MPSDRGLEASGGLSVPMGAMGGPLGSMRATGGMSLSKSLRTSKAPAAPFSSSFQRNLLLLAILSAASSTWMIKHPTKAFHPLALSTQQTVFALSATLFGFVKVPLSLPVSVSLSICSVVPTTEQRMQSSPVSRASHAWYLCRVRCCPQESRLF